MSGEAAGVVLEAGEARAVVVPAAGGRLGSLVVAGSERLVTGQPGDHPMTWGCFPMAPWAGRIRGGRFSFDGRPHQLPVNLAPHAIHGTVFDRPWTVEPDGALVCPFGERWPFGGWARQTHTLDTGSLTSRLEVHAEQPMPASAGFHPWFAGPVELLVQPGAMYRRDAEGIPSGELDRPPPPPPWDDCFVDLEEPPRLVWPDGLTVTVTADSTGPDPVHWVLYTPGEAVCVEPQTGPPDAFTLAPVLVRPGGPLVLTMTLTWTATTERPVTGG